MPDVFKQLKQRESLQLEHFRVNSLQKPVVVLVVIRL